MELTNLIQTLFNLDQEIRKNPKFGMEFIVKTDLYITEILKKIIEFDGLPTVDKVGFDISKRFVMMVQHSRDLEFAQQVCDSLLKEKIENIPKSIMPYLIDKLLVSKGKPQMFGTILETKFNENNEPIALPKPVKDEVKVNKRRAEYGLDTIENYLKLSIENFKTFQRK